VESPRVPRVAAIGYGAPLRGRAPTAPIGVPRPLGEIDATTYRGPKPRAAPALLLAPFNQSPFGNLASGDVIHRADIAAAWIGAAVRR
jgi:hypothetical protein